MPAPDDKSKTKQKLLKYTIQYIQSYLVYSQVCIAIATNSKHFHLFEGQSCRNRGRDRVREIFHLLVHSLNDHNGWAGPGWSKEPRTSSGTPTWVIRSWITSETARTWMSAQMGCWGCGWQLNLLHHKANFVIPEYFHPLYLLAVTYHPGGPFLSPWQPLICFLCLCICPFLSYKWNHTLYGLLARNAFKSLPCSGLRHLCMCVWVCVIGWYSMVWTCHILLIHSSVNEHLRQLWE